MGMPPGGPFAANHRRTGEMRDCGTELTGVVCVVWVCDDVCVWYVCITADQVRCRGACVCVVRVMRDVCCMCDVCVMYVCGMCVVLSATQNNSPPL